MEIRSSAPSPPAATRTGSASITSRLWAFGDGITGTLANPTHVYGAAGVYTVSLTVEGPGGTDTEIKPGYVEVEESPCPVEQTLGQQSRSTSAYRGLRDEVFVRSLAGQRYTALYQEHRGAVARLLARDPQLAAQAAALLRQWQPAVEALVARESQRDPTAADDQPRVTAADVAQAEAWLATLAQRGSPQLQADLEPLLKQLDSFVGQTPAEILEMLEKAGSGRDLYLPPIVKDDFHGAPRPVPATGTADSASGAGITTTRVITYTYDPLNRLVEADYSTGEQFAYGYDEVGNRTVLTSTTPLSGTVVTTYTYDIANRLTSVDGVTYTWDARGNLTHDGTFTYAYNAAGRLVRAESVTATLVYTYNAAGLRVAQAVNGDATSFAWDWATPAAGSEQAPVPELLRHGKTRYLVGHDTLGWHAGKGWAYSLPDALGSVRQVVDEAGAVVSAREWTPFGVALALSGAEGAGKSPAGLGYTGEWWDADVGLEYLRARWYQPGTGRFTTEDRMPGYVQIPSSLHIYVYAWNNPINLIDPSGLQVPPPLDCELGEICYTGTFGPYNNQYPADGIGQLAINHGPFYYNRNGAVAYAAKHNCDITFADLQIGNAWDYFWGKHPYSPFLHANCTNFVSQALAAGGMPMTQEWHWSFSENGQHLPMTTSCGNDMWNSPCTISWGAAPELRDFLVSVLGFKFTVLDPVQRDQAPELSNAMRSKIKSGDVVFHGGSGNEYKHVSLVAGWGVASEYQKKKNPQPCTSLPQSNGIPSSRLFPWIIDRDGPGYSRAFHDVGTSDKYRVEFVHIPDWIMLPPAVAPWNLPPYP